MEAQIKEATTDIHKSSVPSTELCKTTNDEDTSIKNENDLLTSSTGSIDVSEEAPVPSGFEGEEPEAHRMVNCSEIVSNEKESTDAPAIQENSTVSYDADCEEKQEKRLFEGSREEDSSSKSNEQKPVNGIDNLNNGDIQNDLPKLISCDSSLPECSKDELIIENSSENTNSSIISPVKILDSDKIVENNVPISLNIAENCAPKEPLSEKHLPDVNEVVIKPATDDSGDNIHILREDIPRDKVSNQINGEVSPQNLNNSCDEINNESPNIQEGNSDKTLSSPEDASQSKSKKKRKMKK